MLTRSLVTVRARDDAGVTLVELLIVILLVGVVGSIVTSGVMNGLQASNRGQARVQALVELETAIHRVTREVRAAAPIHVAEPHRMVVTSLRGEGRVRWTFTATPAALTVARVEFADRFTTAPSATVAASPLVSDLVLAAPTFTYTKADGSAWVPGTDTNPGDIHRVTVTLSRDLRQQEPIEVETGVYVRSAR